jgi:hypothetical protein
MNQHRYKGLERLVVGLETRENAEVMNDEAMHFLMICSMKSHCSWVMTLSLENSPARDRNSPPSKVTVYTTKRDIVQYITTNVKPYRTQVLKGRFIWNFYINNSSTSKVNTEQARRDKWLHNLGTSSTCRYNDDL